MAASAITRPRPGKYQLTLPRHDADSAPSSQTTVSTAPPIGSCATMPATMQRVKWRVDAFMRARASIRSRHWIGASRPAALTEREQVAGGELRDVAPRDLAGLRDVALARHHVA